MDYYTVKIPEVYFQTKLMLFTVRGTHKSFQLHFNARQSDDLYVQIGAKESNQDDYSIIYKGYE